MIGENEQYLVTMLERYGNTVAAQYHIKHIDKLIKALEKAVKFKLTYTIKTSNIDTVSHFKVNKKYLLIERKIK